MRSSGSAATRLAYDMYFVTYVRCSHIFFILAKVYDLFELLCLIPPVFSCVPPEVIFPSRVIGTCPVTADCIVAMGSCDYNNKDNGNNSNNYESNIGDRSSVLSISSV